MNLFLRLGAPVLLLAAPWTVRAQQIFPTAEAAADAFIAAVAARDHAAFDKILGRRWRKFIPTEGIAPGDLDAFVTAAQASHRVLPAGEGWAELEVGGQGWTLPIPLHAAGGGWRFEAKEAEDEMRTRRIGRNELAVIQAALVYGEAQREFAAVDRNGDGVSEYAQHLISTPGRRDGLFWPAEPGELESPLGPYFGGGEPGQESHGYRFRILTAQGPNAAGGARSYLLDGRLTGGFALVAWPADYDDSGVKTFIVNQEGQVFERDFGRRTASRAARISTFDPDPAWQPVTVGP